MATVSKDLADTIARNDGRYSDDPRVSQIIEYTNAWGKLAYGLEYPGQEGKYYPSQHVLNPRVYWKAKS